MAKPTWFIAGGVAFAIAIIAACGSSNKPPLVDDSPTHPGVKTGPCAPDGIESPCDQVIGQHQGYVDCFVGTQTCTNGVWGPCDGSKGGAVSTHAIPSGSPSSGGLRVQSLSDASSNGPPCSQDPCNPYCNGWNEQPPTPIQPQGCASTACEISVSGYGGLPMSVQQQPTTCITSTAACPTTVNAFDTTPNCDDCNYDTHCGAGNTCVPWAPGGYNMSPSGVDLTLEFPCLDNPTDGTTYHFMVCNRGSQPLSGTGPTIHIGLYKNTNISTANHADCMTATPNPPDDKEVVYPLTGVAFTIPSGQCVDVNSTNSTYTANTNDLKAVGERVAVNWNKSVAETNYCNNWNAQDDALCVAIPCVGGALTATLNGTIKDPKKARPLYGITVYVPSTPVAAFTPGVACDTCTSVYSGLPALASASTATDGTFSMTVPAGVAFPLVIQSGRFRRQVTVPAIAAGNTATLSAAQAHLPSVHVRTIAGTDEMSDTADPDIPLIAFGSGSGDATECLLRKIGIADTEFTVPGGGGRIEFYENNGATIAGAPSVTTLYAPATLAKYNAIVLPCNNNPHPPIGGGNEVTPTNSSDMQTYLNNGGRLFSSHWGDYNWISEAPNPFPAQVNFQYADSDRPPPDLTATVDQTFPFGAAYAQWLFNVGASATLGKIDLNNYRHNVQTVNAPTTRWIYGDSTGSGNPGAGPLVSMFSFDTPVGGSACGRMVVPEMHVSGGSGGTFPGECNNNPMTAQELAFEFMLFAATTCIGSIPLPPPPPPPPPPMPAPPLTYQQTYTATCAMGNVPQWDLLAYNVTTPPGTSVTFAAATGPTTTGPWTPMPAATIATAPPSPQNCPMTGPTPCPYDLNAPLGGPPNSQQPVLDLTVTLTPSSACNYSGFNTTPDGTNNGCSGGKDDNIGSCMTNADCDQDFHCSMGSCVWSGGSGYFDPNCKTAGGQAGIDLTIGAPCATATGFKIPFCNRGGGTLPANTALHISNSGNGSSGNWDCTSGNAPSGGGTCVYTTPNALGPGQCDVIDSTSAGGLACAGILGNGQRDVYINWDKSVTECGTTFTGTGAGCMNNSTHTKATGNGCPPMCGSPPAPNPSLNSWQVTYACVPAE